MDIKNKLENAVKCMHGEMTDNFTPEEQILNIIKELETTDPVNIAIGSVRLSFAELKDEILKYKAKSEYQQASIVILRDIFKAHEA